MSVKNHRTGFLFPIRRYLICRKCRCVFRCGPASAPEYHRQCSRPITNQAGYDIPDVLPNFLTAHGRCFSFQLPERFFHVGVVLHVGISRDTFRFQHGGNRFRVGLFQLDLERKTAGPEGLAQKNIDCGSQVHTQLAVKRFTLFFNVAVQTDAESCCACHRINPFCSSLYL